MPRRSKLVPSEIILPTASDRMPRGISCEGGFRILGTPIGFGAAKGAGLIFVAHPDSPIPRRGSRVLLTPLTASVIGAETRGLDALTLGYGRKIRLGRMDICLFPAGTGPGSAQFEVSFKGRRILYCGGVRLTQPLCWQEAELPTCDLLLLDAKPAEPRPVSPKRVSKKLRKWVVDAVGAGKMPVLCCGSIAAAVEAACTLRQTEEKVRACRPLFEMLCRVESSGFFPVSRLRRMEEQWPTSGAVLFLSRLWTRSSFRGVDSAAVAYVGPGRAKPEWADVSFRLGEGEDRPGLISYVRKTQASQVALGPNCDEATAKMLEKIGAKVYRVQRPTQMLLPI